MPQLCFFANRLYHCIHLLYRSRKMEIAVVTGFSAKRNMNINTRHIVPNFCKLVELKMAKINECRCCVLLMLCFLCIQTKAQKECRLIVKPVESGQNLI